MTVTYSNKDEPDICKTVYNLQQVLTYVDLLRSVNDRCFIPPSKVLT